MTSPDMTQTVEEFFAAEKISAETLEEMKDESEYWEASVRLAEDTWTRIFMHLSEKQRKWLDRIRDDLVEKRIEESRYTWNRGGRDLFE